MADERVDRPKGFIGSVFRLIGLIFEFMFGTLSWRPPPWLELIGKGISNTGRIISNWRKNSPRAFWVTLAVIVAIIAGAYGGLKYYQTLPKPVQLTIDSTSPSPTKLEKDAEPDSVLVYFSGSAARLDQIGKTIDAGITLSPPIQGEWVWENDRTLHFTPQEEWAVGQEYDITFEKELFPRHVRLKSYEHAFQSAGFDLDVLDHEFFTDPKDPKIKQVLVSLKATHPIDEEGLRRRIKIIKKERREGTFKRTGETIPFSLSFDEFKGEAYIFSDNIPIPLDEFYAVVVISEGVRSSLGGEGIDSDLEKEVRIPGMYDYFRIGSVEATFVRNERFEPEQVVVIETSVDVSQANILRDLSIYQLPKDRPAFQGRSVRQNHHWRNILEIGTEVLELSKALKLDPIPTDREFATLHSFKYKAEPGRFLFIRMKKGIKSYGDYVLAKTFEKVLRVPEMPKDLKILHEGSVLSLSGDKKLSILARNVEAIKFDLGRVMPEQINHLVSQTYGSFQEPHFMSDTFDEQNLIDRFEEVRPLQKVKKGVAQYTTFDFSQYMSTPGGNPRGLFFLKVSEWDMEQKRYGNVVDRRFVLITDLGVVVKTSVDGSKEMFVVSINDGIPVNGARVDVLGKNGRSIISETTASLGHAKFSKLTDFKQEKAPTVIMVRNGPDLSFLPFDRQDRVLNLSRFDVGGQHSTDTQDTLRAYLFSDRGIYRPGDTFHVCMIVRAEDWNKDLTGMPLEIIVTDPRGLTVAKENIETSAFGFEEIKYTTQENSLTGEYQVAVYIVKDKHRKDWLGSTRVRVEEFLPDRMRITARLSAMRMEGWVSPKDLKGLVTLQNLFGTPAADRRVTARIILEPWFPAFRSYKDYRFYDPAKAEQSYAESVPETRTDQEGQAEFDLDLKRFEDATYRLTFWAEGYEAEGGRGVSARASVLVSPNDFLIGYKLDGDVEYIQLNSERSVDLMAVNAMMESVPVEALKAHLVEIQYVSVLTKQRSGVYKYESVEREITVTRDALVIPKGGLTYPLPTTEPGDYALIIRDDQDQELNRIRFSIVGQANLTRSLERDAELQVRLNKKDFAPGESIEMEIKAPYTGAGLITIERDKVYAFKWFKTTTTNTVQTIEVPAELEGNGYVNVSFVRALNSREIFMSPLSYGVVPFSVSRDQRINKITLSAPDLARPGELFRMRFKTEHPGKIVLFAVDEGILQVARYKSPKPLDYFFQKKALEVKTSQILDLLLPEFELVRSLSAAGGDAEGAIGANLNPFKRKRHKPVAYWSGIIDSGPEEREVVYEIPDYYNGTLRIMSVAVARDSMDTAAQKSIVRGHFVISPNVPTFVAPGDEFIVSASIANNIEGSGEDAKVNFELIPSEHLELLDQGLRVINVSEGREGSATFKLKARAVLGSATLMFKASYEEKKGKYSIDLSVRPPNPFVTKVQTGYFKKGKEKVPVDRNMYPHFRKLEASGSILPLGLTRGLMTYLDKFPYRCTEQLISKVFPQVVLSHRPEFGYDSKNVTAHVNNTLSVLRARQNSEGAFGFWAANSYVSDFQVAYATHFLTETKERGYAIPSDTLERALEYLSEVVKDVPKNISDAREHAYAIYIRTRNRIVTTNELDFLITQLREKFKKGWETDLTGIYLAATFKLLKQEDKANDLIKHAKLGDPQTVDYNYYYDDLLRDSQLLYILAKHFPKRAKTLKGSDMEYIVKPIALGSFNTTSSAFTILGLDAYVETIGFDETMNLSIEEILPDNDRKAHQLPEGLFPVVEFSDKADAIEFSSDEKHLVFYQVIEAGFDKDLPQEPIMNKLEIQREYRNESGAVVTQAGLGEKLSVHIKVRTIEDRYFDNIVVVDLLPAGFEVELSRGQERMGYSEGSWEPAYVDFREDRAILVGTIGSKVREFEYKIRATNQGEYQIPPLFAESMYDRSIQAKGLGGVMVVEGQQ